MASRNKRNNTRKQVKDLRILLKQGKIPKGLNHAFLAQEIKYTLSESEQDTILDKLDDSAFEFVINNPLPKSYNELTKFGLYFDVSDLKKEISWTKRFILDYAGEINKFLIVEKQFNQCLLLGDYEKALFLINQIENEIAVSVWSIEQKLIIAELDKGFKGNKDTLTELLSAKNSVLVNFIASYTSMRIEKNISPNQYASFVDEYLKALNIKELESYIYFKVDFYRQFKYSNSALVLLLDNTLSIIDRYKAFIQYSQIMLCDDKTPIPIKIYLSSTLSGINQTIEDIDLQLLSFLYEGRFKNIDNNFVGLLDRFTLGDYEAALEQSKSFLLHTPTSFPCIITYVKCLAYLSKEHEHFANEDSIIEKVIRLVYTIVNSTEELTEETYLDLYKIAHFLGRHPLGIGIFNYLREQMPYQITEDYHVNFHKLAALNSKSTNPALISHLPSALFENCLAQFNEFENSSIIELVKEIKNINKDSQVILHPLLRHLKYHSYKFRTLGAYNKSMEIVNLIFAEPSFSKDLAIPYVNVDMKVEKYYCLINLRKYEEALELVVGVLTENIKYRNRFFLPSFLEYLGATENEFLQGNINLPIFFKFYEEHLDPYNIYVAYDNFLCSVQCETPKDFFSHFDKRNKRHIAFLENVCKHEVLHSSPFFKDQEELDLARIEICNFLTTQIDNYKVLEVEVSELLRKVLVRKGIMQLDYSKIYVDVKGLKSNFNKELKEGFNRNIEIASLPVDQLNKIVGSIGNLLVYYVEGHFDKNKTTDDDIIEKVKLTSYNRFLHFKESFLKIRDGFLMSTDYGLDTYLSMRIRHGTLGGQLRSIFEAHNLITVWSETDEQYLRNDEWLNKFNNHGVDLASMERSFAKFSKNIDQAAEELKSKIIQIKTEASSKNPQGLFDYSFTEQQLLDLFSNKFGSIKDFEIFVSEVIEQLWETTEINLTAIRSYLGGKFTDHIHSIFNEFESSIDKLVPIYGIPKEFQELSTIIKTCRTEIVVEIKKIIEWFKKSNKKFIEDFDFSILLESCVGILNRSFRNASIDIENKSTLKLDGDYFPYLTDIFFYLLHNSLKHSRLSLEALTIQILVEQDDSLIKIQVKNNVLDDFDYLQSLEKKIADTRIILDNSDIYERINEEGGTGFPKIKKTLKQDLSRKYFSIEMNLDRDINPVFTAHISFEYGDLIKNNVSENIIN